MLMIHLDQQQLKKRINWATTGPCSSFERLTNVYRDACTLTTRLITPKKNISIDRDTRFTFHIGYQVLVSNKLMRLPCFTVCYIALSIDNSKPHGCQAFSIILCNCVSKFVTSYLTLYVLQDKSSIPSAVKWSAINLFNLAERRFAWNRT
jgi:hypothetical protein